MRAASRLFGHKNSASLRAQATDSLQQSVHGRGPDPIEITNPPHRVLRTQSKPPPFYYISECECPTHKSTLSFSHGSGSGSGSGGGHFHCDSLTWSRFPVRRVQYHAEDSPRQSQRPFGASLSRRCWLAQDRRPVLCRSQQFHSGTYWCLCSRSLSLLHSAIAALFLLFESAALICLGTARRVRVCRMFWTLLCRPCSRIRTAGSSMLRR